MRLIDLNHLGRERVIGSTLIDGVLVDPGPASCLDALLAGLDGEVPRVIALTHIHLDHAGATGALCRRWPDVEVWVHERGAPHLEDPSKLIASATRLYGDDMQRLWGEITPVPREAIRVVSDQRIEGFRVAETPGHASHHVAYLHEATGTLFAGDTAGVRIGDAPTIAPTPPPDIDLEAWNASLDLLASWDAERVVPTHFGVFDDVAGQLDAVRLWLDTWARPAAELEMEAWVDEHQAWVAARTDPDTAGALLQAAPIDQCWLGLRRYWSKREGR
ncbi:MAG TPA: MBL fold metallo-hydrolase [Capillimicrobium sp.]|nr:MBL fold metallo-hydrolase [Capillimicrobium sp.]